MQDPQSAADTCARPMLGVLAEFASPAAMVQAARALTKQGCRDVEAFSPFPIHGLDDALRLRPTRLPWLVFAAGSFAGAAALAFQWWTNAWDYPFVVSGKPLFSLPANIPVTFEVIILAAATVAFVGMIVFSRLPRLSNPLFRSDRFLRASNDRFLIFVSADELSQDGQIQSLLWEAGAKHVEAIDAVEESDRTPAPLMMAGVVAGVALLIPPLMISSVRMTTSDKPRLHTFFDMDFQPKLKSQTTSDLFADRRAMRPRVPGTVPRRPGLAFDAEIDSALETGSASAESHEESNWVKEFPLPVTDELMRRGREQFNIHCAVCHGRTGAGNGLASLRALELEQGTWVPPTSIHADHVRKQPVGQIFNTITHGIRKMPPYGHQIPPEDRWAIVLYMQALQRSQDTTLDDVPLNLRPSLRAVN